MKAQRIAGAVWSEGGLTYRVRQKIKVNLYLVATEHCERIYELSAKQIRAALTRSTQRGLMAAKEIQ